MYTLHMSWQFRTFVLGVLLTCGLASQVACFMPDQALTTAEMDCCKTMAGDCSGANMTHACCKTVVRSELGVAARIDRHDVTQLDVVDRTSNVATECFLQFDRRLSRHTDHDAPDKAGGDSLILRI
jgi:hypothetical protein